mgnify:CR=1 FL=1
MNLEAMTANGQTVAVLNSAVPVITDVTSALDVMMAAKHETGSRLLAIEKTALPEDFFILSTGLAGEILQKFTNYGVKCAVFGDFSGYTSKPLRDFLYESNQGRDFFFVATREEAQHRLKGTL